MHIHTHTHTSCLKNLNPLGFSVYKNYCCCIKKFLNQFFQTSISESEI